MTIETNLRPKINERIAKQQTETEPAPTIEVSESEYSISIDGIRLNFKEPSNSWSVLMFLCHNPNTDLTNSQLQQYLKSPDKPVSFSQTMRSLKAKCNRGSVDTGFIQNKATKSADAIYRLNANVVFPDPSLPDDPKSSDSQNQEKVVFKAVSRFQSKREDRASRAKKRLDQNPATKNRMEDIKKLRQQNLKTDLAMVILSNFAAKERRTAKVISADPTLKPTNPLELITTITSDIKWENAIANSTELALLITDCKSADELTHWCINAFSEVINRYWDKKGSSKTKPLGRYIEKDGTQETGFLQTRETKIIDYCQELQGLGFEKEEILTATCENFGMKIPTTSLVSH